MLPFYFMLSPSNSILRFLWVRQVHERSDVFSSLLSRAESGGLNVTKF
jgi:hypothetical protein